MEALLLEPDRKGVSGKADAKGEDRWVVGSIQVMREEWPYGEEEKTHRGKEGYLRKTYDMLCLRQ